MEAGHGKRGYAKPIVTPTRKKGIKSPRITSEEQQHDPTHPQGTFHQDRLESLRDQGQHDAARDPDEDEEDEDEEEVDRISEPPVVREPDED